MVAGKPHGPQGPDAPDEFLQAGAQRDRGLLRELVAFMAENKVWWMAPLLLVLALFGVILALGGTGAAPFIYVLFG